VSPVQQAAGILCGTLTVLIAAWTIWATFDARIRLITYVHHGRCGGDQSLQMQLTSPPYYLMISLMLTLFCRELQTARAVSRVSFAVATASWIVCAFVG
jgi:hypothetical protein